MLTFALLAWMKDKRMTRVKAIGRVVVYAGVIGGFGAAYGVSQAHASVAEGALEVGRDMLPLREYIHTATPLTLNGEHIVLATGSSDKNMHEVLDAFETFCRTAPDAQPKDWAQVIDPDNGQKVPVHVATRIGGSFDMGVYRAEHTGEGMVMCFMRSSDSQRSMTESMQAFEATHDFGAIGKMRYAYVHPTETGRSTVLTAWTDEHFRLDSFLPEGHQDAPGSDPAGLPRPPDAQRFFSAQLQTSPFGAHLYHSAKKPDDVRNFYDGEMTKAGWLPVGWGDPKIDDAKNRAYMKDGLQVVLTTAPEEDGRTLVSLGEVGGSPEEESSAAEEH